MRPNQVTHSDQKNKKDARGAGARWGFGWEVVAAAAAVPAGVPGGVLPARPGGGPAKGFPPPPQRSQPPGQSRPGRFTRARGQASVAVPPLLPHPPRAEEGTENTKKRTFPASVGQGMDVYG